MNWRIGFRLNGTSGNESSGPLQQVANEGAHILYLRWDDKYLRELAWRSVHFNAGEIGGMVGYFLALPVCRQLTEGTDTGPIAHGGATARSPASA